MRAISVLGKTNLGHEELICLAVPWAPDDGMTVMVVSARALGMVSYQNRAMQGKLSQVTSFPACLPPPPKWLRSKKVTNSVP